MSKKELFNISVKHNLGQGLHRKTAIRKGVLVAMSWALQPILPRPLYWLLKKTIAPVITAYITVKLDRAVINHVSAQQGRKLQRATTDGEFRDAFNELASV